MATNKATEKAKATEGKILDAALELFRTQGFEATTMRDIAAKAGVATGAAYYYFPSKDAIVMAFYQRTFEAMQPKIRRVLESPGNLEARMRALFRVKIEHFGPNRAVLRGTLKYGADPSHALSPFSKQTKLIRDADVELFAELIRNSGITIPKDLAPYVPESLWMYQLGIIYFWLTDESEGQARSRRLVELSAKTVAGLLELASLPLTRSLRKPVVELMQLVLDKSA